MATPLTASIPTVLADTGATGGGSALTGLLPLLLIGLLFYFLLIRPQRRRQQEHQKLMRQLEVGDRVVTIGGFYGDIIGMTDDTLELELAPGVAVTMSKNAVSRSLTEHSPVTVDDLDDDFDDDLDDLDDLDPLDDEDDLELDDAVDSGAEDEEDR